MTNLSILPDPAFRVEECGGGQRFATDHRTATRLHRKRLVLCATAISPHPFAYAER